MADRPNPNQPSSVRRRKLRFLLTTIVVASAGLCSGSGCTMVNGFHQAIANNDALDQFMVAHRNRAWSAKAWHRYKHCYCDKRHQADFCAGFRQGYEDAANGGNGCTPAIAPQSYWGWRYQSPEGQAKVNAWFEGYPLGAKAAEEDGLGSWGSIRTMLPVETTMPPCAEPLDGLPMGTAPTPIDPVMGPLGANGSGNFGPLNLDSIPKVSASSVPTTASGR